MAALAAAVDPLVGPVRDAFFVCAEAAAEVEGGEPAFQFAAARLADAMDGRRVAPLVAELDALFDCLAECDRARVAGDPYRHALRVKFLLPVVAARAAVARDAAAAHHPLQAPPPGSRWGGVRPA